MYFVQCTFTDLTQPRKASVNCHDEQVPTQQEKPPVSRKVQSVHNFLPSDTTWRSAGQCHVIPTDAHVHCSAKSSLWWIHTTLGQSCTHCLNEGIRVKFDCTIMAFRDYFGSLSSVNPPHRLHKPIQRRLDMTQYYIIITCIFDESAILRPYRMYGR